jgi:hypothetical protein
MTQTSPETEREAFIKAHRHLDLTEISDAWGQPMFRHSHVEAIWDGWRARSAFDHAQQAKHPFDADVSDGGAALARTLSAQAPTAPDLLKYTNHLTDCRYRGGHDCDCGLDEIRAALSDTSTDRPCDGCDGHECDNGCAYPGAVSSPERSGK